MVSKWCAFGFWVLFLNFYESLSKVTYFKWKLISNSLPSTPLTDESCFKSILLRSILHTNLIPRHQLNLKQCFAIGTILTVYCVCCLPKHHFIGNTIHTSNETKHGFCDYIYWCIACVHIHCLCSCLRRYFA